MNRITAAAVLLAVSCALTAQDRDTLETKVTADGGIVLLEWSKKHPWGLEMAARGAALVAEYVTGSRGLVSEVLRVAPGRANPKEDRALRFRLPERIASPPQGPVCLFIQLPNRKVLPVRKANNRGDDTSRFRFEAWEAGAAKAAAVELLKLRISSTEAALAVKQKDVETQQSIIAKGGWTSPGACQQVASPVSAEVRRPYDAVDPREQDPIARKVCIHRVWFGEQLIDRLRAAGGKGNEKSARNYVLASTSFVRSPASLEAVVSILKERVAEPDDSLQSRFAQATAYSADWQKWEPAMPAYSRPHFGEPTDTLDLQSTAREAAQRMFRPALSKEVNLTPENDPAPPRPTDAAGYLGGSLEAYFRCVEDGRKQLATKYESWTALRAKAPELQAMAQADMTRACQREFGLLERLKNEVKTLEEQLVRDRDALKAAEQAAAPAGGKSQVLNSAACSAQASPR